MARGEKEDDRYLRERFPRQGNRVFLSHRLIKLSSEGCAEYLVLAAKSIASACHSRPRPPSKGPFCIANNCSFHCSSPRITAAEGTKGRKYRRSDRHVHFSVRRTLERTKEPFETNFHPPRIVSSNANAPERRSVPRLVIEATSRSVGGRPCTRTQLSSQRSFLLSKPSRSRRLLPGREELRGQSAELN